MLTERQKRLYSYLLEHSSPNKYISKLDICINLNQDYNRLSEKCSDHNSNAYCSLRKDIDAINRSDVEKVIVSSSKGYKIGTKEEAERYIKREFRRSLRLLKKAHKLQRKYNLNDQTFWDEEEMKVIQAFSGGTANG